MAQRTFEGVTYTRKHLSVHWRQEYGGTARFETLRIPWDFLARDKGFQDHLGYAIADYMSNLWGMTTEEHPLF